MAALNGDPVTESCGLWILVGADPEIHLADALARHLLEGAEHPAGAHGGLQLFIGHLAALGLNPDLLKNVNPEAFVPGICFVIMRLDLLKDHRLELCALGGGLRGEGSRASQGKQSCRWSQKCTHAKTAFAYLLAGMFRGVRASQGAL